MMKKIKIRQLSLILIIAGLPLILRAQVLDSLGCTGALGDVKYSILEHDDFQEVNGDCWTLMDGKTLDPSSELADKGFTFLPDARGVFIRSYDNRQDNRLDTDREFGEPIGTYQDGAIQSHNHTLYFEGEDWDTGGVSEKTFASASKFGGVSGKNFVTSDTGITETRPKNITLWTYIRIY